jgi:type II secretory pathway pseudopilin PulG
MRNRKNQKGYTLLEYCAGAAIIGGVLWTALNGLSGNIAGLLGSVGGWADARSGEIVQ